MVRWGIGRVTCSIAAFEIPTEAVESSHCTCQINRNTYLYKPNQYFGDIIYVSNRQHSPEQKQMKGYIDRIREAREKTIDQHRERRQKYTT